MQTTTSFSMDIARSLILSKTWRQFLTVAYTTTFLSGRCFVGYLARMRRAGRIWTSSINICYARFASVDLAPRINIITCVVYGLPQPDCSCWKWRCKRRCCWEDRIRLARGRKADCKPHHGLLSISLRHLLPTKDMVNWWLIHDASARIRLHINGNSASCPRVFSLEGIMLLVFTTREVVLFSVVSVCACVW